MGLRLLKKVSLSKRKGKPLRLPSFFPFKLRNIQKTSIYSIKISTTCSIFVKIKVDRVLPSVNYK